MSVLYFKAEKYNENSILISAQSPIGIIYSCEINNFKSIQRPKILFTDDACCELIKSKIKNVEYKTTSQNTILCKLSLLGLIYIEFTLDPQPINETNTNMILQNIITMLNTNKQEIILDRIKIPINFTFSEIKSCSFYKYYNAAANPSNYLMYIIEPDKNHICTEPQEYCVQIHKGWCKAHPAMCYRGNIQKYELNQSDGHYDIVDCELKLENIAIIVIDPKEYYNKYKQACDIQQSNVIKSWPLYEMKIFPRFVDISYNEKFCKLFDIILYGWRLINIDLFKNYKALKHKITTLNDNKNLELTIYVNKSDYISSAMTSDGIQCYLRHDTAKNSRKIIPFREIR